MTMGYNVEDENKIDAVSRVGFAFAHNNPDTKRPDWKTLKKEGYTDNEAYAWINGHNAGLEETPN